MLILFLQRNILNGEMLEKSKEPLIILIGGASGVGTSSMAFELASRLGLKI